jgi:hypothetical protein
MVTPTTGRRIAVMAIAVTTSNSENPLRFAVFLLIFTMLAYFAIVYVMDQ